jgi:hypothetical protein
MSGKGASSQPKQTGSYDPRDNYIYLGRDERGFDHVFCTKLKREGVYVIDPTKYPDGRRGGSYLDGKPVEEYVEAVKFKYGWANLRYGGSLADVFFDAIEIKESGSQ